MYVENTCLDKNKLYYYKFYLGIDGFFLGASLFFVYPIHSGNKDCIEPFPLPEIGGPIFLEIWNHWGKVVERSGLRFEFFCLEVV